MSSNKSKANTPSGKNNLTIPLILSLCANLVLVVAVVVLALRPTTLAATEQESLSAETASVETSEESTSAETETDADTEEETYYFEDYNGDTIEITSYDAYITGEFICAGDATNWAFTYDEDTGLTSVYVTGEDGTEIGTYDLYFYLTTDESSMVGNLISEADESESYIYYVLNILDDEDSSTAVGIYFESATEAESGFVLYTPDVYEEYLESLNSEESTETESEETTAVETEVSE